MVYKKSLSNGMDDDDFPSIQANCSGSGVKRGRPNQNEPSSSFNIDQSIRELEIEAYIALLKAFSAQSEVITWSKEALMSDLRMQLKVTEEQHRKMLGTIGDDQTLQQIRNWRQTCKDPGMPPHHPGPSSNHVVFPSEKRQRTGSSSGKKSENKGLVDAPKVTKSSKGEPSPRLNKSRVGGGDKGKTVQRNQKGESSSLDPHVDTWVGRRLQIKWPEDNTYYEAVVVDYNKNDMLHRVVYDRGTPSECFEWVDLKRMDKDDVQWLDNEANMGSDCKVLPSKVVYPEVTAFVKEMNALHREKDVEKLESGRRKAKEYEEMLQKALAMVTDFSIDDGSENPVEKCKEDGDSDAESDEKSDGDSAGDSDEDEGSKGCNNASDGELNNYEEDVDIDGD